MQALAIERRPPLGEFQRYLEMLSLPVPEPRHGEVRIRITASAINVDDKHLAEGTMFGGFPVTPEPSPESPWVPGVELTGCVDALGAGVTHFEVGERVYGLCMPRRPGAWAEYAIVKARHVHRVPSGWPAEEAACLCVGSMMVCGILERLGQANGKHCLVVGASGSIGTMLVPALREAGARVWGVCSGRNRELMKTLGAERVIDYRQGAFGDQVRSSRTQVDAVIDLLGGLDVETQARAITRRSGRFITVVGPEKYVGERRLSPWALTRMLGHMARAWLSSKLVGPSYHFVAPLSPDFVAIDQLVSRGIRPTIDQVVPFERDAVRRAIGYVASRHAHGKVVIAM